MTAYAEKYKVAAMQAVRFDPWILIPVLILIGFGLMMVMSASSIIAESDYGDEYHLFKRQVIFLATGTTIMLLLRFFPVNYYRFLVYPILFVVIALMILVMIPGFGYTAGGATRWFRFGMLSGQPSEAAKLALVIYLAYSMAKKGERMKDFSIGVLPHVLIAGFIILLTLLQKDLGMSIMIGSILFIMLFLGGARITHLLGLLALAIPVGVAMIIIAPYRMQRLIVFLDPWVDPQGTGFQIIHSFYAFASGGLLGVGLGSSHQKLHYLPEPHTDFIFSILGEEIGFLGVFFVVLMFLILAIRGFVWASRTENPFVRYLSAGLTLLICLQALVNMAVVLGLLPTTGLTLPFISYGGSSLLVNMTAVGILLAVSAELKKA